MREIELHGVVAERIGRPALVDDEDYNLVRQFRWLAQVKNRGGRPLTVACRYYRDAAGKVVCQYMHTLITGWDRTMHVNFDGLDNQRSNLQETTHALSNIHARPRVGRHSAHKGVTWSKTDRKWQAAIQVGGQQIYLGQYRCEKKAARIYDLAALEHFGPDAYFNFPEYLDTVAV